MSEGTCSRKTKDLPTKDEAKSPASIENLDVPLYKAIW